MKVIVSAARIFSLCDNCMKNNIFGNVKTLFQPLRENCKCLNVKRVDKVFAKLLGKRWCLRSCKQSGLSTERAWSTFIMSKSRAN